MTWSSTAGVNVYINGELVSSGIIGPLSDKLRNDGVLVLGQVGLTKQLFNLLSNLTLPRTKPKDF